MSHFEVDSEQVSGAFRRWHANQPFDDLLGSVAQLDPLTTPVETAAALDAFASRLTRRFTRLRIHAQRVTERSVLASDRYSESEQLISGWLGY